MHIFLINQYYPPDDAPTGLMLESVANSLAEQGHEVTVLCSAGGYAGNLQPERADDAEAAIRILRIRATRFGRSGFLGKLADYLTFYIGVTRKLLTIVPGPDRIIALTTPPYLSVLARLASKFRGCDHAHWVMDLYPDVMTAHGMIRGSSVPASFLARLTRWGFGGSRCRVVLTLGPDMEERTKKHLSPHTRSVWVPLWGNANSNEIPPEEAEVPAHCAGRSGLLSCNRQSDGSKLILMYSGNMGLGHRFTEFLRAARESGPDYEWRFNGGGRRRPEIEDFLRRYPGLPINLGPYISRENLAKHLGSADVHLLSLEPTWNGTMVPSKLAAIFSAGRPVIFVGSADCSIGQWIIESGGGWVVPPDNAAEMNAALREALLPSVRLCKGKSARGFAECFFNRSRNSGRIASIFSEAAGSTCEPA